MNTKVHDILIPCANGVPDHVQVCLSETDDLGRQLPYVRVKVKIGAAIQTAIAGLVTRAETILANRVANARTARAETPTAPINLDAPLPEEDTP